MKLIKKLIHLEEKTVEDINKLKESIDDQYVSFSSLLRRLIRIGLDNFDKKEVK